MTDIRDRLTQYRAKVATRMVAGIGGLAAITVSLGMALYDARTQPTPRVAAGQAVDAGQWTIEVDSVEAGTVLPDGRRTTAGRGAVVLTTKLTNRTAMTSSDFGQAIKLATAVPGIDEKPVTYLLRDGTFLRQLHPRLAERVAYVWTYPLSSTLPQKARFELIARKYKPRDNLYASAGWFNPGVIGEVELPLPTSAAARRPAAP